MHGVKPVCEAMPSHTRPNWPRCCRKAGYVTIPVAITSLEMLIHLHSWIAISISIKIRFWPLRSFSNIDRYRCSNNSEILGVDNGGESEVLLMLLMLRFTTIDRY